MKSSGNELTRHEEAILNEMGNDGETYGHGYIPFHSLPSCPQGIKKATINKLVKLGFLQGFGKRASTVDGIEYVWGYDAVAKVRDLNVEHKTDLLDAINLLYPNAKMLHCWHSGSVLHVVALWQGYLAMLTATGVGFDEDGHFEDVQVSLDKAYSP